MSDTATWYGIAERVAKLTESFEDTIVEVRMSADDMLIRIADARELRERRNAENAEVRKEYYPNGV